MIKNSSRSRGLLKSQVYEDIKKDIIHGVYKGGEQLATYELAERYNISVTPVRDALNALQQEGLVEILPRIGYFVTHMTTQDIQDIFDLRVILEGASAELAAKNITEEELRYLEQIPSDYIPGDDESYLRYLVNNRNFHYRIALASRNKQLAEMVAKLLDQMQRLVFLGINFLDSTEAIINNHPDIIAALRKRDGIEARRVLIEGLEVTRKSALEVAMRGVSLPITSSV